MMKGLSPWPLALGMHGGTSRLEPAWGLPTGCQEAGLDLSDLPRETHGFSNALNRRAHAVLK